MNYRLLFILSAVLAVSLVSPAEAGWGSGGCAVVQTVPVQAFSGWYPCEDAPHILGWYADGVQTGAYNTKTHIWRDYDRKADKWGAPKRAPWVKAEPCKNNCQCEACEDGCDCPKGAPCGDGRCGCLVAKAACACKCGCGETCPCGATGPCEEACSCQPTRKNVAAVKNPGRKRDCQWVEEDGSMNYGIDLDKMSGGERAVINGREVSKKQLLEAIGAPTIPDDAKLLRLTIVAEDSASLAKLKASVLPQLAPIADKIVVQWYTKDNWAIRSEYGFHWDKLPAVLLEEPEKPGERGGKAIFQASVPADPAPVFAAVRSKIDSYDPKKVPGMPGPAKNIPPAAVIGVGALIAAGWLILKK